MKKYNNCSIFFDTNAFENYSEKDSSLYEITASELFYNIRNTVEQLGLEDCVHLCIPEIVWLEIKQHLLDKYRSTMQSLNDKIKEIARSLGDLINIGYELKDIKNLDDYEAYIDKLIDEFIKNPKNGVMAVEYPRDSEMLEHIVDGAIKSIPPFKKAKGSSKEHTDAGLKDALIWETVKAGSNKELTIFVTNDYDFRKVEKEQVYVCSNIAEIKKILIENMNIAAEKWLNAMLLSGDSYLLHQILVDSGFNDFKSARVETVMKSEFGQDEFNSNTLFVNCDIRIDEIRYLFNIEYDTNANELVAVSCDEYLE